MVFMFILPSLLGIALGSQHSVTVWSSRALNQNVVPPITLLLLFVTPVNWKKGEFVLQWKEVVDHSPWDVMLLTAAAAGVVDTLVEFRVVELAAGVLAGMGFGPASLPFVAAASVSLSTNFISGVAATGFFGSIFIPFGSGSDGS